MLDKIFQGWKLQKFEYLKNQNSVSREIKSFSFKWPFFGWNIIKIAVTSLNILGMFLGLLILLNAWILVF